MSAKTAQGDGKESVKRLQFASISDGGGLPAEAGATRGFRLVVHDVSRRPARAKDDLKTPLLLRINQELEERERLRREASRLRDEFTTKKRDELLRAIEEGAGNSKTLRAQAELTYFLTMFQVNSAERGTRQMAIGTWVLAIATIGLFIATIVLAVLTASGGA
jgi:hypothetical protein